MSAHDKQEVRLTEPDMSSPHSSTFYRLENIMNAKIIVAATAFFATASVFAQGNSEFVEFTGFTSTKTRAEVKAEIAQASATPEFVEFTPVASTGPRAGFAAATASSTASPEFVEHVNIASTRTRAEVREEMAHAAKPARTLIGG